METLPETETRDPRLRPDNNNDDLPPLSISLQPEWRARSWGDGRTLVAIAMPSRRASTSMVVGSPLRCLKSFRAVSFIENGFEKYFIRVHAREQS